MRPSLPIRYLLPVTHFSVFLFTALFIGFSTYFITKDSLDPKKSLPQISEKAAASKSIQEYLVYERREEITSRPNNLNRENVTGYAKNLADGEEYIIYSFTDDPLNKSLQKTVPTATLLTNGNIFINGVSDNGYAVLTINGENVTMDYAGLKKRDFPLKNAIFTNEREIIYSYGGVNSKEKDSRHKIYWKKQNNKLQIFDSETFPIGEFWLKPAGWSSDPARFYAERESDVTTYAKIWRISLDAKKITPLNTVKGAVTKNVRICGKEDYAVFISSAINPTSSQFGEPAGPSKLLFSDLTNDNSKVIFSSEHLLSDLLVSCESRKILIKEKNTYRIFDSNGKESAEFQPAGAPLFFSGSGKMLVVEQNGKFMLLNIQNGKTVEINKEKNQDDKTKISYNVLGFVRQ